MSFTCPLVRDSFFILLQKTTRPRTTITKAPRTARLQRPDSQRSTTPPRISGKNKSPRVPFLCSKPVLRDRYCDEMIDKRALLTWIEAQDQPRRGAEENKNGASDAVLSSPTPHKALDTTTTTSRNHTVICSYLGKNYDTINKTFYTKNNTKPIASDRNHQSKAST